MVKFVPNELTGILDLKSWTGSRTDWQPKAMITLNAVAVNTYLQDNEGKSPPVLYDILIGEKYFSLF